MDIPKGSIKADLVYKSTPKRELMLTFLPPVNKKYEKAPVYFIIPGGGWHKELRQDIIDFCLDSVESLRNQGFAVVGIDYRVCNEGIVMNDIIIECFDAVRYIAHFADVFEIDKEKFALSGHSAGAHLALMLSYAPKECFKGDYEFDEEFNVKCVAAMSPPTILYDKRMIRVSDLDDVFIGCNTKEEKERTSPITYVTKDCPTTFLCAGTSDPLVSSDSSEELYEKLKNNKVKCELRLSVGGGHCFEQVKADNEPSITMNEIQKIITDFILKNME